MILHAMNKFRAFAGYDPNTHIHHPDWGQPLVRTLRERKMVGIYAGCPVGLYRKYVGEATVAFVLEALHLE
jgi:hypothetical protein